MDWQANYVARLAEDGRTLDLFAWLTLTNSNDESFPAAMVNAIAGQLAASPVAVIAQQEELGDLKLYRIPEPVTVAANGQKQVALLNREKVKADNLYSLRLPADSEEEDWRPVELMLRTRNNKDKGLGLPLPAGSVAVFELADGRGLLAGEARIADLAIEDDVELRFGESPDVQFRQRRVSAARRDKDGDDQSRRAKYEVEFQRHPGAGQGGSRAAGL